MPTDTSTTLFPEIPTDVRAFADREGLTTYLPGIIELTRRLFPEAVSGRFYLDDDPDALAGALIVTEVAIRDLTPEDVADRSWRWNGDLRAICPSRDAVHFSLTMDWLE